VNATAEWRNLLFLATSHSRVGGLKPRRKATNLNRGFSRPTPCGKTWFWVEQRFQRCAKCPLCRDGFSH